MYIRKFNRQFILLIDDNLGAKKKITSPLTCEFTVTRHNLASSNEAHFVLYNLKESTQNDIDNVRNIEFYAGYEELEGGMLPRVFKGQVLSCFSYREGSDFRTEIECREMWPELNNNPVNIKIPLGTPRYMAINSIAAQIANIGTITVSQTGFLDIIKTTMSELKAPFDLLTQFTNKNFYIDSSNVYALQPKEVLLGELPVINLLGENGLLGSPKKMAEKVIVSMIFEPRVKPSQLISFTSNQLLKLSAKSVSQFNGNYKLTGFVHSGIISGAVNGDCRTEMTLINLIPTLPPVIDKSIIRREKI